MMAFCIHTHTARPSLMCERAVARILDARGRCSSASIFSDNLLAALIYSQRNHGVAAFHPVQGAKFNRPNIHSLGTTILSYIDMNFSQTALENRT